eukprot:TRINITY_DN173_c0_g1_i12.p1 TRINITY_DN173_c0_g1~~TRINITY_DN173_c0_g1_i12.p1  ORF type:complete len:269 (-),score=50.71 TRINITY_DN173_c0_g1_i12:13-819(-)
MLGSWCRARTRRRLFVGHHSLWQQGVLWRSEQRAVQTAVVGVLAAARAPTATSPTSASTWSRWTRAAATARRASKTSRRPTSSFRRSPKCAPSAASSASAFRTSLKRAPFLEAVIMETLRLFPSVPSDTKTLTSSTPVALHSVPLVQQGEVVSYKIAVVQRNPAYWTDPDDFIPERWLDRRDLALQVDAAQQQFYFPAFHAGRRLCLGKRMAILEAKNCLATLFKNNISLAFASPAALAADDLADWHCFTATPVIAYKNGMKLKVQVN